MISGEELVWLIDVIMSLLPMCCDVVLNFIRVNIGHPAINIHNGEEEILSWKIELFEFGCHLLGAPINIWPFSLVLIFSQFMGRVIYLSEFRRELIDELLSFDICALFMFFHRQIYKVGLFGTLVSRQYSKGFFHDFNIFFIVRYDNRMEDFLSYLVSYLWRRVNCPSENSPVLVEEVKTDQCEESHLETCNYDEW